MGDKSELATETCLLRDLVYILQGIDGHLISFVPKKDAYIVSTGTKPSYSISASTKELALKIAEVGWLFSRIKTFCEGKQSVQNAGFVSQSFISAISSELAEYYRFLAVIQAKLEQLSDDQGLCPSPLDDNTSAHPLTLRRLLVISLDWKERLKVIASLVDAVRNQRGSALISTISTWRYHGDPPLRELVLRLLTLIVQPLIVFIVRWMFDGFLQDPYDEFFISADMSSPDDLLWHKKYSLRTEMLPAFLSKEHANRVLLTGKSINFLRLVCKEQCTMFDELRPNLKDIDARCFFDNDQPMGDRLSQECTFGEMIDSVYTSVSREVLDTLNTKFFLSEHFCALKKYMLLSQGDFARHLMDVLYDELEKPAKNVLPHTLTGHLEAALRQTNAQFEMREVLERIDIRSMEKSRGDKGWDIFNLTYHVRGPIKAVFTDECMLVYGRFFDLIWRMKRLDYVLGHLWRSMMRASRRISTMLCEREISGVLHSFHTLEGEMLHFVQQLQYYVTFEVLECAWEEFQTRLRTAHDLDGIIVAHRDYLETLLRRMLLDTTSEALFRELTRIFELVFQFQTMYERFSGEAEKEVAERGAWVQRVEVGRKAAAAARSMKDKQNVLGTWVQDEAELRKETARRKRFVENCVAMYRPQLDLLRDHYRRSIEDFLCSLAENADDQLRMLHFRLDFSQFYRAKNERLTLSLSYRRQSRRYDVQSGRRGGLLNSV